MKELVNNPPTIMSGVSKKVNEPWTWEYTNHGGNGLITLFVSDPGQTLNVILNKEQNDRLIQYMGRIMPTNNVVKENE